MQVCAEHAGKVGSRDLKTRIDAIELRAGELR